MPDSIRTKEIHACLEADTYASYTSTNTGEKKRRVANLGYYVEGIASLLGLNRLADGSPFFTKSKQQKTVEPEQTSVILEAPYLTESFGEQEVDLSVFQDPFSDPLAGLSGDASELTAQLLDGLSVDAPKKARLFGIAYENISNRFIEDPNSGEVNQVAPNGFTLCHNIPQLLQAKMDDADKSLGMQEASAFAIASGENLWGDNNDKFCTYEGLHSLVAENAFQGSAIHQVASQANVASQLSQAMIQQIIYIQGLPLQPQSFEVTVGIDESGEAITSPTFYPAFADASPTHFELWTTEMKNIGAIYAEFYGLSPEEQEQVKNLSEEEVQTLIKDLKDN